MLQVAAVYEQCGFEHDSGLATVQMLGNLEARLEELSAAAFELSPEVIFASQRQREKDRRQVRLYASTELLQTACAGSASSSRVSLLCHWNPVTLAALCFGASSRGSL